jgi:hypothetical protein
MAAWFNVNASSASATILQRRRAQPARAQNSPTIPLIVTLSHVNLRIVAPCILCCIRYRAPGGTVSPTDKQVHAKFAPGDQTNAAGHRVAVVA